MGVGAGGNYRNIGFVFEIFRLYIALRNRGERGAGGCVITQKLGIQVETILAVMAYTQYFDQKQITDVGGVRWRSVVSLWKLSNI